MNIDLLTQFWAKNTGFHLCYVSSSTLILRLISDCILDERKLLVVGLNNVDQNFLQRAVECKSEIQLEKYQSAPIAGEKAVCNYEDLATAAGSNHFESFSILFIISTEDEFMRLRCLDTSNTGPIVVMTAIPIEPIMHEFFTSISVYNFLDHYPKYQLGCL